MCNTCTPSITGVLICRYWRLFHSVFYSFTFGCVLFGSIDSGCAENAHFLLCVPGCFTSHGKWPQIRYTGKTQRREAKRNIKTDFRRCMMGIIHEVLSSASRVIERMGSWGFPYHLPQNQPALHSAPTSLGASYVLHGLASPDFSL